MQFCLASDGVFRAVPDNYRAGPGEVVFPTSKSDAEMASAFHGRPIPALPDRLLALLAARRWEIETGGMDVNGVRVATDDRSRALIDGAKTFLGDHPAELTDFKSATGWIAVDLTTITAIFDALGAHIQRCFAAERAVGVRIRAGELTSEAAVYAALDAEMNGGQT